ncbi:hypothetical protein JR316_0004889 [Psilocybe cubensis]|uniref:Uncharacterized protein n=2 Tax=Psilocybe cubensis TaxID=181762 RepID=A0ACB8H4Y5_PSICU|nr:hypothetical protein JR316_0004889 [Psilocybe cubensis]KAH9482789.1 hypothetical protein JR316_0004889 [Psilocybe cubensis]
MPMKIKELEIQNKAWRDENLKLFEDNQRLVNTVKSLNATISMTKLPESAQFQRISDLESEVRRLQAENERIRLLVEVPDTLQTEYAKLVESQRMMRNSYMSIREENRRLSEQLQGFIQHGQPPQPALQHDSGRHQTIPTSYNIQHSIAPLAHIQNQHAMPSQGQYPFSSSLGSAPLPQYNTHTEQRNPLMQTQAAVFQNRQQSRSNPSSRRSSLNLVSPAMYPYQQIHVQGSDPAIQRQQQPYAQPNSSSNSITPSGTHVQQNTRRSSLPITYHNWGPNPCVHDERRSPSAVPYASEEQLSNSATTVSSIQSSRGTATPPTPIKVSHNLAQQSQFAALVSTPSAPPAPLTEETVQPVASTIAPQDTHISQPDMSLNQPVHSMVITSQALPSTVTPNQQVFSNHNIQEEKTTSSQNLQQDLNTSSSSVEQVDLSTSSAPINPNSSIDQSTSEVADPPSEIQNQAFVMQVDASSGVDEEEVEQESDVGPDGLRLLQICLEDLFGEPDENGRVNCKLCLHRYQRNIQSNAPPTFINATDEELVAHAVAEHKRAWDHIRQPEVEGQE